MQNKTAPILLITGTVSIFISVIISIFFNVYPGDPRPFSFEVLQTIYFVQEIIITAATILFAVVYMKSGFEKMKIAAILYIVAGVSSLAYFTGLHYTYSISYSFRYPEQIVSSFLWLAMAALNSILAVQLLRNRINIKAIAWIVFLIGADFIIQSSPGIYRQGSLFFNSGDEITGLMKLRAFLFLIGLAAPIGYLLLAKQTEESSDSEISEEGEFHRQKLNDNFDLLDTSMEEKKPGASHPHKESNSVLWWMINLVITSIPIIGIGFLIRWSVAKSEAKRGNWAVATVVISMISFLLLFIYNASLFSRRFSDTKFGMILIGVIIFTGIISSICVVYNKRNQENLSLEDYSYTPTVGGWIGYMLLMIIPVVNIVMLIVYANDNRNTYLKKWAQAMLLMIPLTIMNYILAADIFEILADLIGTAFN